MLFLSNTHRKWELILKNKCENIIASGLMMSVAGTAMANSDNFEGFGVSAGVSSLDVKVKSSGESDS